MQRPSRAAASAPTPVRTMCRQQSSAAAGRRLQALDRSEILQHQTIAESRRRARAAGLTQ
jgi:hypothetical protein